jgi:GNAT superfamily N-acetyltransferase
VTLELRAVSWEDPAGVRLRVAQRVELTARYEDPDSEPGPLPTADDMTVYYVAYDDGEPVGCGGLRTLDTEHGEIKRMYVAPAARGSGVAVALLRRLEADARALGWKRLVLETGERQPDAMRFYEREGYRSIPPFGYYVGSSLSRCYEKVFAESAPSE